MLYVYHQVYQPQISKDGKKVTLVHFGEYKYLSEAYCAMSRFIKDNLLVAKGAITADYVKNEEHTPYCERYVTVLTAEVDKRIHENKAYA